jgi:hypothetical protein
MEVQHPSQALVNSSVQQDVWDEAKLEEAMNRLKLLHIKVRTLRSLAARWGFSC